MEMSSSCWVSKVTAVVVGVSGWHVLVWQWPLDWMFCHCCSTRGSPRCRWSLWVSLRFSELKYCWCNRDFAADYCSLWSSSLLLFHSRLPPYSCWKCRRFGLEFGWWLGSWNSGLSLWSLQIVISCFFAMPVASLSECWQISRPASFAVSSYRTQLISPEWAPCFQTVFDSSFVGTCTFYSCFSNSHTHHFWVASERGLFGISLWSMASSQIRLLKYFFSVGCSQVCLGLHSGSCSLSMRERTTSRIGTFLRCLKSFYNRFLECRFSLWERMGWNTCILSSSICRLTKCLCRSYSWHGIDSACRLFIFCNSLVREGCQLSSIAEPSPVSTSSPYQHCSLRRSWNTVICHTTRSHWWLTNSPFDGCCYR